MPCLDNRLLVFNDHVTNLIQLARAEPIVPCERDRRQPELCVLSVTPHVYVHRFVAVKAVKEEPVRPWNAGNPRQSVSLSGQNNLRLFRIRQVWPLSSFLRVDRRVEQQLKKDQIQPPTKLESNLVNATHVHET
jgi:ATP/maltotriose-dependent transcriptional regulator MalT